MKESFEDNIKELEKVVTDLEKGELSLDDSIKIFEKGIQLSKECNKSLDEAEQKINILVESNGKMVEEPFKEEE